MSTKPRVFIHTNAQQYVGARVSEYSITRSSPNRERFDIHMLHLDDYPGLKAREGNLYLREGRQVAWRNGDLQSFTPLRFLPPQVMGYQGRALVIDPDVFAVSDIHELLSRDMQGKAIVCRKVHPDDGKPPYFASSVMLLDCSRLTHWRWEEAIEELFTSKRDYRPWMSLLLEPEETIGPLEEEWNHFDTLNEKTRLLHNTARVTQPWKTGLAIDFMPKKPAAGGLRAASKGWLRRAKDWIRRRPPARANGTYRRHPDPNQEQLFFSLLGECLERGVLTEKFLREEVRRKHLRPDVFSILKAGAPGGG